MNEALQKAREKRLEMKAAGIEMVRLDPIEKAKKNPRSLRAAINGKCWECSNEQRNEIKLCPMTDCPLYPVRPYQ